MKLYAYENSESDKGVIIADSMEKAKELFLQEYPTRTIVDNIDDYYKNGAYLFEVEKVQNNKLFCAFPC